MGLNSYEKTDVILDSIADGVFTVDENWLITSFNKAAEVITGVKRNRAIGHKCCDVLRADVCETACSLRHTKETGKPVINKMVHIVDSKGRKRAISISTALLKNKQGKIIGGVETFRDMSIVEELQKEIEGRYCCEDIISRNHAMRSLFALIPSIAQSTCTVLIEGESGTGKELFARAIHNISPRKKKPFIAVNCGALPDTLLESELFGYKAGAFTDAKTDKPGRFALAEGGTIFLDEIGDISPAMQVRLLRVLQERTYEPLGSTVVEKADVRVIAATNKRLSDLVKEDKFRQDLYYRINVMRLELPSLRKRMEDIPLLIEHLVRRLNSIRNKNISGGSREVLEILMAYNFPGNVRELENILEHAFVLCNESVIQKQHLPAFLLISPSNEMPSAANLRNMEKDAIVRAIAKHNGNRLLAAKELGIHKSTLFRKIKALQIQ